MRSRHTITFTGRVQGVGFRATTVSVAQRFNVSGWVRNERDGGVLCVVEGEADELDRFTKAIQQAMHGCVRETHIQESPATGEFSGFGVRH
jgi:acylphosphatase